MLIFLVSIPKLSFSLTQITKFKGKIEIFLTFCVLINFMLQCTENQIPFAHENEKKLSSKAEDFSKIQVTFPDCPN